MARMQFKASASGVQRYCALFVLCGPIVEK
jgi:hypothetical protein